MGHPLGRLCVLVLAVAVSACVPAVDEPPAGTAFIEISEGGSFSGTSSTVIYADDSIVSRSTPPQAKATRSSRTKGPVGAYVRVSALLAAEGPKLATRLKRSAEPWACADYGSDTISAEPAVGRFSMVSVSCPSPEFDSFLLRLRRAVAAP